MTRQEKLKHIQEHPELHKHNFGELQQCSVVDGAIDLSLIDAHSQYVRMGTNGGQRCDVTSGPCACGSWH